MKKVLSIFFAAALCLGLAAPASAYVGTAGGLTAEIAQAYLDIVDGLVGEYGMPRAASDYSSFSGTYVSKTWEGQQAYWGMAGGYAVDLGGDATPELVVCCSDAPLKSYDIPVTFVDIYAWDGTKAVQVGEYDILASGNGRSWPSFYLCVSDGRAEIDLAWEYLDSPSAEHCYYRFDGRTMTEVSLSGHSDESRTLVAAYDYALLNNLTELRTLLRSAGANPIDINWRVAVDGNIVEDATVYPVAWTDAHPFVNADYRTMVPLRAAADALKLDVEWDPNTNEAVFSGLFQGSRPRTVRFPVGENYLIIEDYEWEWGTGQKRLVSQKTVPMDTATVAVNGRTYAPIRYLAENFGHQVTWDGSTNTVIINVWISVD